MQSGAPLYSLHLSTAKTWRGGENQLWLLARGLKKRGQRVLIAAPPGAPLLERCQAEGIPTVALRVRGDLDLPGAMKLMSLLRRERPDILHLHDGHAILPGQCAARIFSRAKLSVVAHRRTAFKVNSRWKFGGRVDRVVAISGAARECLLAAGVSADRIRVVYSGLEFPDALPKNDPTVAELRRTQKIPDEALIVAHAAGLTSEKRQADIIQALRQLNEQLQARGALKAHLVLAGSGEEEQNLRAEVEKQSLQDVVHFAGFMRDLRALWAASSMVIFASEAEGLCTALIEAQATGLPAVITRAGGMLEVVEDAQTGITANIGDVQALADGLLKLALDRELRERMGTAAAARVRQKFSADVMVEGIVKVYEELRHT